VGRKNWLLVGRDSGGRTAAVLFRTTASCKQHGVDPFRYLADVLWQLPTTPSDWLAELLPDIWFQAHPHAARKQAA
jgi:transposase